MAHDLLVKLRMDAYLFQPVAILPSQFFATLRRHAPNKTGEWQLLVAVLEDAVDCFKKYVLTGHRRFREAEQWIMSTDTDVPSPDDNDAWLPFEYVCEVLGLDPVDVRRSLQRWREAQLAATHVNRGAA